MLGADEGAELGPGREMVHRPAEDLEGVIEALFQVKEV